VLSAPLVDALDAFKVGVVVYPHPRHRTEVNEEELVEYRVTRPHAFADATCEPIKQIVTHHRVVRELIGKSSDANLDAPPDL